jgi:hypothetical protein
VVFFDKKFERWSFLTLRWRRWSLLSKILGMPTLPRKEPNPMDEETNKSFPCPGKPHYHPYPCGCAGACAADVVRYG